MADEKAVELAGNLRAISGDLAGRASTDQRDVFYEAATFIENSRGTERKRVLDEIRALTPHELSCECPARGIAALDQHADECPRGAVHHILVAVENSIGVGAGQPIAPSEKANRARQSASADSNAEVAERLKLWADHEGAESYVPSDADRQSDLRLAAERLEELERELDEARRIGDFDAHVALPEANEHTKLAVEERDFWKDEAKNQCQRADQWEARTLAAEPQTLADSDRQRLREIAGQVEEHAPEMLPEARELRSLAERGEEGG